MKNINRLLPMLSLLVLCPVYCAAQTPARDTAASISGRVTVGGKGAAGITVVAAISGSYFDNKTVAKTATDDDGNYRLTGLSAGRFTITPIAKAFVAGNGSAYKPPGQSMLVVEGESITKIDFALVRGGVITGRITDAQGNPIIGERVDMSFKDTPDASRQMITLDRPKNKTDDRGIYRIYGLGPGSYKVSVGQVSSAGGAVSIMGMGGSQYVKTFYPGVQEESKATIIEVKEGAEVTGIDITPGKSAEGFSVSGRAVDAESGQPVADVFIGYSSFTDANQHMSGMNFGGSKTDANGKFRLEGIRPGRYAAFTVRFFGQDNTSYSDPTPFDISEGDVTGIEIKVRRGGTIDGVAVIENNPDPAVTALLQTVPLIAFVQGKGTAPSYSSGQIQPDGSFRFAGLAPGKVRIVVMGLSSQPKGLTLVRTELDGLDQQDGIEMAAGAQISGVRLVFAYGTGSIRGEVKIEGGVLPEGTTFRLSMRSGTGDTRPVNPYIEVDARGRFVSENILPGTYELSLQGACPDPKQAQPFEPVKQTITVANGAEVRVIFVVDLAAKKAGSQ